MDTKVNFVSEILISRDKEVIFGIMGNFGRGYIIFSLFLLLEEETILFFTVYYSFSGHNFL